MPNDNKLPNTGDDQQVNQSNPTTPMDTNPSDNTNSNLPPIMVSEESLPPMPNMNPEPVTINSVQTEEPKKDTIDNSPVDAPVSNSGSAAPANDIMDNTVMPAVVTSTPKKKFAGGKVIATILGLFILVGGIGAGVFLTGQNQNPNEKAAECSGSQYDQCRLEKGTKVCECEVCGICTRPDSPVVTPIPSLGEDIKSGNCSESDKANGYVQCGSTSDCSFCLRPYQRTCNQVIPEQCPSAGGGIGSCLSVTTPVTMYYCKGGVSGANTGCQGKDTIPGGVTWDSVNKRIQGHFCGTIQVDDVNGNFCSLNDTSGCSTEPTPSSPSISARCQNIKAYSETWTLLTATDLSNVKAADKVNFCVTGSATSGAFDKAKLTINGVVQAETTSVRPSSTDFCQLYTIPAATTTFNLTAQIHHASLGWK